MRPFPHAHYYVGALLIMTFAAFWPSYFSTFTTASFAHHLHGMTATAWMVLLMTQNWTIHHKHRRAHIISGWASLALVPAFTAGGFLTMQVMTAENNPFLQMYGFRLASVDILAALCFCAFFALALKNRRNQHLHARYMLSTILILPVPVVARFFMNYVPGYLVRGPEDLPNFGRSVEVAIVISVIFVGVLILRDVLNKKPVLPFTLALAASLLSYSGYFTWAMIDDWHQIALAYGALSPWIAAAIGTAVGIATGLIGWYSGKPARKPISTSAKLDELQPTQA
ncbi:hypothetical protein [Ponticaulis sp.]|uniref:hypothetical protein n=1 Tax=Ponticaulis sp. TaxID=2020902 RepID=UPI002638585A|nr:hypothetical protein [Ponticaulis sp.]MDF1679989.1 hypothetical protein [Ponticaulis sp.]